MQHDNRRLHFARAVHSRHPLPGRSHFQWTRQRRNDPLCRMTLLVIEWSLLQPAPYSALLIGKENTFPAIAYHKHAGRGPSHGHRQHTQKNWYRLGRWFRRHPVGHTDKHRHTDRQTHTSQYFTTALEGEVTRWHQVINQSINQSIHWSIISINQSEYFYSGLSGTATTTTRTTD